MFVKIIYYDLFIFYSFSFQWQCLWNTRNWNLFTIILNHLQRFPYATMILVYLIASLNNIRLFFVMRELIIFLRILYSVNCFFFLVDFFSKLHISILYKTNLIDNFFILFSFEGACLDNILFITWYSCFRDSFVFMHYSTSFKSWHCNSLWNSSILFFETPIRHTIVLF